MIRLTRLGFFFVLLLAVVFYWENPAPAADVGRPDPGYSFPQLSLWLPFLVR